MLSSSSVRDSDKSLEDRYYPWTPPESPEDLSNPFTRPKAPVSHKSSVIPNIFSNSLSSHFRIGSLIQLWNGDLKRVEDLNTQDFIRSAEFSSDVSIDESTIVSMIPHPTLGTLTLGFEVGKRKIQVTVEAALEHPFFVYDRGWSSASPGLTGSRYHLPVRQLVLGDVCISLSHKDQGSFIVPSPLSKKKVIKFISSSSLNELTSQIDEPVSKRFRTTPR